MLSEPKCIFPRQLKRAISERRRSGPHFPMLDLGRNQQECKLDCVARGSVDEVSMIQGMYPTALRDAVDRLDGAQQKRLVEIQAYHVQAVDVAAEEQPLAAPRPYEIFHLFLQMPPFAARPVNGHRVSGLPS